MSNLISEIEQERLRQVGKGYTSEHDDEHTVGDFVFFIKNYSGWAAQMASMGSMERARRRLIQVAALAIAAVQTIDRRQQEKTNG